MDNALFYLIKDKVLHDIENFGLPKIIDSLENASKFSMNLETVGLYKKALAEVLRENPDLH